jgi:hypothetical protein
MRAFQINSNLAGMQMDLLLGLNNEARFHGETKTHLVMAYYARRMEALFEELWLGWDHSVGSVHRGQDIVLKVSRLFYIYTFSLCFASFSASTIYISS